MNRREIKNKILYFFANTSIVRNYYIITFLLFLLSLVYTLNFFAAQLATHNAGNSVPDIFDFFSEPEYLPFRLIAIEIHFYWTRLLFLVLVAYGIILYPKKIIQLLFLIVSLVFIRMVTINLTHLGEVINQPVISGYDFTFGGDLFFSGHVAYTFIFYLILRETPVKYLVLVFHIIIALSTIIGRFHYAIDVVGAYAISYSLYKLTEGHFKKMDK